MTTNMYFNEHLIDELVGIVGMLNNRDGSTLKDITIMLESLHGPVRKDVVQNGLRAAISSGLLDYINYRYKVHKQSATSARNSFPDLAGCSSWNIHSSGMDTSVDVPENKSSISSFISQGNQNLRSESSPPSSEYLSIDGIPSGKTSERSCHVPTMFTTSYREDLQSEDFAIDSKRKEGKSRQRKRPIIKLPISEKNSENAQEKLNKWHQEMDIGTGNQTQESLKDTECNTSLGKNGNSNPTVKISIGGIMNEVMKQFSDENDQDKEVLCTEENENNTLDGMSKVMTEVMKKINYIEKSDSVNVPESLKKDTEENGTTVKSLGEVITNVMKRFTFGNSESTSHDLKDEDKSLCADNIQDIKAANRSVGVGPQDISPCSSFNTTPKSAKRGSKTIQENDSNETAMNSCRYLTRSRAKDKELRRSHIQSPSGSCNLAKRAKLL